MVGAAITLSGHRILTHEEYIHDRQLQKAMAEARDHRSIYHVGTSRQTYFCHRLVRLNGHVEKVNNDVYGECLTAGLKISFYHFYIQLDQRLDCL